MPKTQVVIDCATGDASVVQMSPEDEAALLAGQAEAAPDPNAVPRKVPTWRLNAVAEIAGLSASIDAAIDALPAQQKAVAKAGWHRSIDTYRDSALLAQMTAALGLTAGEVDAMFVQAAALEV